MLIFYLLFSCVYVINWCGHHNEHIITDILFIIFSSIAFPCLLAADVYKFLHDKS